MAEQERQHLYIAAASQVVNWLSKVDHEGYIYGEATYPEAAQEILNALYGGEIYFSIVTGGLGIRPLSREVRIAKFLSSQSFEFKLPALALVVTTELSAKSFKEYGALTLAEIYKAHRENPSVYLDTASRQQMISRALPRIVPNLPQFGWTRFPLKQ
ncbi:MAG: hypothetical protein AAB874_06025 [Patescibacteria group bacterium]